MPWFGLVFWKIRSLKNNLSFPLKNNLKPIISLFKQGIRAFFGLILLYLLISVLLSWITYSGDQSKTNGVKIYVISNGVHTDLVLPAQNEFHNWTSEVRFEHTKARDTTRKWVSFGWGDKGFYLETPNWSDLKTSTAFKAAFSLGSTAMHTKFHKKLREEDRIIPILVQPDQYMKLVKYITQSFQKDSSGHFIPIQNNAFYGKNDSFYEAVGSYSMFKTCNTWTNDALKTAGLKACFWTPWDKGILYQYDKPIW